MYSILIDVASFVLAQAPTPKSAKPPGGAGLERILDWAAWIALGVGVLGFLIAGSMMTISARRGEGGEHASRLGWVMAGCVVVSSSSAIVNALIAP